MRWLVVIGMVAIGVLVWRALERQDRGARAGSDDPADREPPTGP